ncbi:hypothetical protein BJX65DRAFT_258484 [Aspergillus insuetus]
MIKEGIANFLLPSHLGTKLTPILSQPFHVYCLTKTLANMGLNSSLITSVYSSTTPRTSYVQSHTPYGPWYKTSRLPRMLLTRLLYYPPYANNSCNVYSNLQLPLKRNLGATRFPMIHGSCK